MALSLPVAQLLVDGLIGMQIAFKPNMEEDLVCKLPQHPPKEEPKQRSDFIMYSASTLNNAADLY